MLEGPSFLVSRELPSACEQESKWAYNASRVNELSTGKHNLKDEEKPAKKLPKLSPEDTSVISLSITNQSGNRPNNQSYTSPLISQIGRDLSINCLLRTSRSDYCSIASLSNGFRSLIQTGELYRLRRLMGVIEHWVYFSCNLFEWEAFDPIRCRWMRLPHMDCNECFMYSDKESLAVGTDLLVFGKEINTHVVYKYSILTNTWAPGSKTNTPRCLFGSASQGEFAIVAGGCDLRGTILRSAERYNSEKGTWECISDMNKPRKMCSGVFMDSKFYVIGGVGENKKQLTCGEVYDEKTDTWTVIPDMFPAVTVDEHLGTMTKAPPLLAVVKNELYAAYHEEQEVRKYEKGLNIWNRVGGLPERASSMNGWGLAFRACGDRLIVIGGPRSSCGGMIELNAWGPDEGPMKWNLLARKQSSGFVYNCAVMGC